MNASEFRKELTRIMPGYSWTIHKPSSDTCMKATGIQSSGFNRLSTLRVIRTERDGAPIYEAKSAGHGTRALFLHTHIDGTLARALRGLQDHYEQTAATYASHAKALKIGRQPMAGEAV
jgi:hypothetical protein